MAIWKKVIVSGSNANLASLQVDNLTSGSVVIGGGTGSLTTTPINGTGNIVATTGASGLVASGSFSGSFQGSVTGSFSGSFTGSLLGTSSFATSASYAFQATSASFASTAAQVNNALTFGVGLSGSAASYNGGTAVTLHLSGASALTSNLVPKWTGTGLINSNITDTGTQVQIGGGASSGLSVVAGGLNVTGNSIFNNNLTITGDLTVNGTASFVNSINLYVKDQFILINSGSGTLGDAGIIAQYNVAGSGSALFLEAGSAGPYGRWAVAYDLIGTTTSATADEWVVTAKINQASVPSAAPTWGNDTNGMGNLWVTTTGDIYIYA